MANSPLMLNMIIRSLKATAADNSFLWEIENPNVRGHILNLYIGRMCLPSSVEKPYSSQQTIGMLRWLAGHMVKTGTSVFAIEDIQPHFLSSTEHTYYKKTVMYSMFLFGFILCGLTFTWMDEISNIDGILNTADGLWDSILVGLGGGLVLTLATLRINIISLKERLTWRNPVFLTFTGPLIAIVVGVAVLLAFLIIAGKELINTATNKMKEQNNTTQPPNDTANPGAKSGAKGVDSHTKSSEANTTAQQSGLGENFDYAKYFLIASALSGLLVGLILRYVGSKRLERRVRPSQGLQSAITTALVGLFGSIVIFGFIFREVDEPKIGVILGILVGLLFFGGDAVIMHMVLRRTLAHYSYAPFHYTHFLDFSVDRQLLHRIGDGYVFFHRSLMEHFSAMTNNDVELILNRPQDPQSTDSTTST